MDIIKNMSKKSRDLLYEWWEKEYPHLTDDYMSTCDLFEFFDEQGIIIDIFPTSDEDGIFWGSFAVDSNHKKIKGFSAYGDTRQQATDEAIKKAMEILNDKLK